MGNSSTVETCQKQPIGGRGRVIDVRWIQNHSSLQLNKKLPAKGIGTLHASEITSTVNSLTTTYREVMRYAPMQICSHRMLWP